VADRTGALEGLVTRDLWRDRRVLITGHTGFKGAWLAHWLGCLGAEVSGLSLAPPTEPSLHTLLRGHDHGVPTDVRDAGAVRARVEAARPQVVFHLAAQSLVRASFDDPAGTFATNVLGTAHVLDAAATTSGVEAVVVVTSDKVYEPSSDGAPHDEMSPLGGRDPYSSSKAACELLVRAYRSSVLCDSGVAVATARAGNVIGGGDWATDRVVPDVLRARAAGEPVRLRYPDAVRPWQHVLDPLAGYLLLAERLLTDPADAPHALNFGPDEECTVHELVERLTARMGGAQWVAEAAPTHTETTVLRLSAQLAHQVLGWQPCLDLDAAIAWTAEWHLAYENGDDARGLCNAQIEAYEALAGG
jgi:CDP-glucose 4,6-dehydratase